MDLYSLGVVVLVLLSGEEPAALMDPVSLAWRWPEGIDWMLGFATCSSGC